MELEVSTVKDAGLSGQVILRRWSSSSTTKALLGAGIAAAVIYVLGDLTSGIIYNGDRPYSFMNQWISELTAIGSPVRPLMVGIITVHDLLVIAFGLGIWRVAASSKSLRWAAGILIGASVFGLAIHPFFPMTSRWLDPAFTDTLHGATSFGWSMLIVATVVLVAVAYRGRLGIYSVATAVTLMVFGLASGIAIKGLEQNDTPLAGAFERINAYALMAWLIVLAWTAIRRLRADRRLEESFAQEAMPAKAKEHALKG